MTVLSSSLWRLCDACLMMQKWFNRLYIGCYWFLWDCIWIATVTVKFLACNNSLAVWCCYTFLMNDADIWMLKDYQTLNMNTQKQTLHEIMKLKSGGKLNIWLVNKTATWHKEKQHIVLCQMTSEWKIQHVFQKKNQKHFKGNVSCRWRVWTAALRHFRQPMKAAFLPFCLQLAPAQSCVSDLHRSNHVRQDQRVGVRPTMVN